MKRHWFKKILVASALLLLPVGSGLLWIVGTESGLHWVYQLANPYLPASLTIEKIEGRLAGPLTLTGMHYQQDGVQIESEQAIIDWQPMALLTANIDISQLHLKSLKIILPTAEKTSQAMTLPDIHLPWRLTMNNAIVENISITQAGETTNISQIKLDASALFSRIDIRSFGLVMDNFELSASGNLNPVKQYQHKLTIDWQARLPSLAIVSGKGLLQGDTAMLKLQQQVTGAMQLSMNAEVHDVTGTLNWQANAELSDFDSARVDSAWPEIKGRCQLQAMGDLSNMKLNGSAEGDYAQSAFDARFQLHWLADNNVHIEQLILHSTPGETRLDVTGNWLPGDDGGHAALDLNWQNLRWPLDSGAWFDTARGSGRIEGNLQHYRFDLITDRPWPQAPPSTWYASADGNLEGLDNFNVRVTALDGETMASGRLGWSPALTWQAEIKSTDINPGVLWPQWPGKLQAMANSTGSNETGPLIIELDMPALTGELRGNAVSLQSHLRWLDEGFDISHFELQSGNSHISAHGLIGSRLALNWNVSTANLDELYPNAKGKLIAEGVLNGTLAMPLIEASFNGEEMALTGYSIGKINGEMDIDLLNWKKMDVVLDAENLKLDSYMIHSLHIHADTENLLARAVTDNNTLVIELVGNSISSGWQGQILKADILSSQFNDWLLLRPTDFSIDKQSISLETPCWKSNEGQLCLSLKRIQDEWRTQLSMTQVPLMVFSHWLPPELIFEGHINATAELEMFDNQQFKGSAQIDLPPGAVSYPLVEGEREHWQYRGGQTDIKLNIQGLQASTEFAMSNGDGFNATLLLPGFNLLTYDSHTQSVEASAKLSVHNLGFIEALIPEVQNFKGELSLDLIATGTMTQPEIKGQAKLSKGELRIPRLGLNITQINFNALSKGLDKINFHLDAYSGGGRLDIDGDTRLNSADGWPASLTIRGESIEASQIPEARLLVSPDLKVKIQKRQIDVSGSIHIPYAKLQPKDVTTAKRTSADAVIVGDQQLADDKWLITSKVRLTLGERVNFYGFGFEGRFAGSLELTDKPGLPTSAVGEISVPEGRYSAYGQRLDVEHGRLLYTGGPVTNPGLDLRAVRHVGDITAGLLVRGSLNKPQVELFSIPVMGQTDVLAYILLGAPIENASGEEGAMMARAAMAMSLASGDYVARTLGDRFGLDEMRIESSDTGDQASLVIGRYLSPRLYVSYGVGLIETINTLNVRYKISDKWTLKGESGENQSADFLYTIER